ncbi:MAG: tetratricopeptide repeat protein [Candidatus Thorarchaeota archaeon]|nr:tetratricopeptide repeat protein [Candidatus Thorarchaeota archaeon]
MKLRELADAVQNQPMWQAIWYITNSVFAALTCLALSRWGYLPWNDMDAILLGFFVPLGVYGFKSLNGWYRYQGRYGTYGISEKYYELSLELIEKDDWEEALRYLDAILRVMPDHLRALYYASVCKEKLGDDKGAIMHITEYLRVKPDDEEALELQIRVSQS